MTINIETADLERRARNVDTALPPPTPTLFEVAHRRGIWEVTKDGRFYGHYHSQQPAFENDRAGKPTPLSILDDERLGLGVVVRIA